MARQTHHQPKHQGCGQDCTYRGLYEGTQSSLADMARRQTEALRRVGRLRAAIVLLLKRHFPQAFTQAEANIGTRLSETDDEVLLAYLTGFIGNNPDGNSEQYIMLLRKLSMLKTELLAAGLPLSGDDPQVWVEAIRIWRKNTHSSLSIGTTEHPEVHPVGNPPIINMSKIDIVHTSKDSKSENISTKAPLLGDLFLENSISPINGFDQQSNLNSLGDLFVETVPENVNLLSKGELDNNVEKIGGQTLGDIFGAPNPQIWPGELGETALDDSGRWSPTPIQAAKSDSFINNEKVDEKFVENQKRDSSKSSRPGKKNIATPQATLNLTEANAGDSHNIFSGQTNSKQTSKAQPRISDSEIRDELKRDLSFDENVDTNWVNPFDAPPGLLPDFDIEKDSENTKDENSIPEKEIILSDNVNSVHQNDSNQSTSTSKVITGASNQHAQGVSQPLRPELFPVTRTTKTNKRGTKTPRARAERPDPHLLDIPIDYPDTSELSMETRQKLLASCLVPRPVFTSDLLSIAGSSDTVSSWEAELRADPATSPVRFLAAKGRHRLRGSLIIPVNEARDFAKGARLSWWSDCVSLYRGSRLYELGVVLHRVGDEIVAAEFDENVAVLRLSSPRGLVGVVVVFDTNINEEPAMIALRESIEQLLKERLTLIAVLTSAGEAVALTNLTETVANLALSEHWTRNIPVIAARSWEFADDRGSTAQLVFGG